MLTTRPVNATKADVHLKLDLVLQFGRFPNAAAHRAVLRKARVVSWMEPALKHPAEIAVRVVG